jgi:hypothetical protein
MENLISRLDLKALRRHGDALKDLGSPIGTKLIAWLDHFDDRKERDRLEAELREWLPASLVCLPRR